MGISRQRSSAITSSSMQVENYLLTDLVDRSTVFEFWGPGSTTVTFLCVHDLVNRGSLLTHMRQLVLVRAPWLHWLFREFCFAFPARNGRVHPPLQMCGGWTGPHTQARGYNMLTPDGRSAIFLRRSGERGRVRLAEDGNSVSCCEEIEPGRHGQFGRTQQTAAGNRIGKGNS